MSIYLKVLAYVTQFAALLAAAAASPSKKVLAEIQFEPERNKYAFRILGPGPI